MNEPTIQEEEGLFDNFLPVKPEKGRLYHAVTLFSILDIAYIFADFVSDLKNSSTGASDWLFVFALLSLPLLALFFHLMKKRIGWFIGYFCYTVMSILLLFGLANQMLISRTINRGTPNWRGMLFTLLTASVTIFLLSKTLRAYFRVSTTALIITSVITIITGIFLSVAIF